MDSKEVIMENTNRTTLRPFGAEFLEEIVLTKPVYGCEDEPFNQDPGGGGCGDSSGYNTFTSNWVGSIDQPGPPDN
jgi:hypothetical protein